MPETLKAISLWQPYASAIALGHKSIETRGWRTHYRGPILIHAARQFTKAQRDFASVERAFGRMPERVPLGAIVAVGLLHDCRETDELALTVNPIEKLYGDYTPGRFGWLLRGVFAFAEPVGFCGRQGLFDVPFKAVAEALAGSEYVDLRRAIA
jgi:hypothetical protein